MDKMYLQTKGCIQSKGESKNDHESYFVLFLQRTFYLDLVELLTHSFQSLHGLTTNVCLSDQSPEHQIRRDQSMARDLSLVIENRIGYNNIIRK